MGEKLLSIIVPCYNCEKTIKSCYESIINQKAGINDYEIIFIDDGSEDNTLTILKEIASTNHNIKVIHQENQGVASARNTGLDEAKGKYISFVDADDTLNPEYYYKMLPSFNDNDVDLVICGVNSNIHPKINEENVYLDDVFNEILNNISVQGYVHNKIYKTNIIKSCNISFNSEFTVLEDLDFNMQYINNVSKVVFGGGNLYNYTIDNLGTMRSGNIEHIKEGIKVFQHLIDSGYYNEQQLILLKVAKYRYMIWIIGKMYEVNYNKKKEINMLLDELRLNKKFFNTNKHLFTKTRYWSYKILMLSPRLFKFIVHMKNKK